MKVLFVTAHPDDIESRMGGTAAKYKAQGHDVYYLIATDGQRGGGRMGIYGTELGEIRRKEALAAAAYIGANVEFLGFADHKLIIDANTYEKVEEAIIRINPDVVFTLNPDDYHMDHRNIASMVIDVGRGPIFLSDTLLGVKFDPEFYVDTTEFIDIKKKMLSEHKSQSYELLVEYAEVLNRFRGLQNNTRKLRYAEAYRAVKKCNWLRAYELLPK